MSVLYSDIHPSIPSCLSNITFMHRFPTELSVEVHRVIGEAAATKEQQPQEIFGAVPPKDSRLLACGKKYAYSKYGTLAYDPGYRYHFAVKVCLPAYLYGWRRW
jgi:hypothetical protein